MLMMKRHFFKQNSEQEKQGALWTELQNKNMKLVRLIKKKKYY